MTLDALLTLAAACLTVGLVFDGLGGWWMRRIVGLS